MSDKEHHWNFFTNHAHVLFYLKAHPDEALRKVALEIGITERAVQRIVAELEEAGCLTRARVGRKNHYEINGSMPLRHSLEAHRSLQDLLEFIEKKNPEPDILEEYSGLDNWTVGEHGSEV